MALSAHERRELAARGRRLKAEVTIAAGRVSDNTVEHVRRFLAERELAKVRIRADSREECEAAAAELVQRVPCELVRRVGRVVLLHRRAASREADAP